MMATDYERMAAQLDEQAGVPPERDRVHVVCGKDLKPQPIAWLWRDWLALGKMHILAGPAGCGKTTLMLTVGAAVTVGGHFPDNTRCKVGNVLVWSGEDDPSDTLLPRLLAAGADASRVFFVQGSRVSGEDVPFDPARDMVQLMETITAIGGVSLLIVDPVVSAVTGDSHKNTEVRRALQPLVDLGAMTGAAVLGISHFAKGGQGQDPSQRVVGSVAFSAVARVVLVAAKTKGPEGEERRVLARAKSNIGPDDGGFEYHLAQQEVLPGIQASKVMWGLAVAGTARELLAEPEQDDAADKTAAESAEDFLRELLADCPVSSKQVKADALDAGYAWATVRRAADAIGVERKKGGMDAGWYWRLPEGAQKTPKVLTSNDEHLRPSVSTFGRSPANPEAL